MNTQDMSDDDRRAFAIGKNIFRLIGDVQSAEKIDGSEEFVESIEAIFAFELVGHGSWEVVVRRPKSDDGDDQ